MLDKTTIGIPATLLNREVFTHSERFFESSPLLKGGHVVDVPKLNKDPHGSRKAIFCGPGHAIRIAVLRDARGFHATRIDVNFPKLLWGHNGRILTGSEFARAASIYVETVEMLVDDRDGQKLLPGLCEEGGAWWQMIEIPMHLWDRDGVHFHAFVNARHSCSPKRLHVPNESVGFGKRSSKTQVVVYRKRAEMEGRYKSGLIEAGDEVLRFEVRLKGEHLLAKFEELRSPTVGTCVTETGEERLAAFSDGDVRQVHQRLMNGFDEVSPTTRPQKQKTDQLGCFIAHAHHRYGDQKSTVHDWIALFADMTKPTRAGQSGEEFAKAKSSCTRRIANIKKSCFRHRKLIGDQDLSALFCDDAYREQPSVEVPLKERVREQEVEGVEIHPAIGDLYAPGWENEALTELPFDVDRV